MVDDATLQLENIDNLEFASMLIQGDVVPAPNTYSVPPVMGRGQPWFPEDPGCTAVMVRDQYYSFMKDLARTPGPAAHKVVNPDVRELQCHIRTHPPFALASRDVI